MRVGEGYAEDFMRMVSLPVGTWSDADAPATVSAEGNLRVAAS